MLGSIILHRPAPFGGFSGCRWELVQGCGLTGVARIALHGLGYDDSGYANVNVIRVEAAALINLLGFALMLAMEQDSGDAEGDADEPAHAVCAGDAAGVQGCRYIGACRSAVTARRGRSTNFRNVRRLRDDPSACWPAKKTMRISSRAGVPRKHLRQALEADAVSVRRRWPTMLQRSGTPFGQSCVQLATVCEPCGHGHTLDSLTDTKRKAMTIQSTAPSTIISDEFGVWQR